jgi:hypothetical protein
MELVLFKFEFQMKEIIPQQQSLLLTKAGLWISPRTMPGDPPHCFHSRNPQRFSQSIL